MKKGKKTNNDMQNTTQQTKDRETRTSQSCVSNIGLYSTNYVIMFQRWSPILGFFYNQTSSLMRNWTWSFQNTTNEPK